MFGLRWLLALVGFVLLSTQVEAQSRAIALDDWRGADRLPDKVSPLQDIEIRDDDRVIYRGSVDLNAVLDRIRAGQRDKHPNDGSVFRNREGILPKKPNGYYREFVVRTRGLSRVGPQRVVIGHAGEVWYTPNHYDSFYRVK